MDGDSINMAMEPMDIVWSMVVWYWHLSYPVDNPVYDGVDKLA